MSTSPSGLIRLSPGHSDQVDAAARLHAELLPGSVPSRLGHHFMTRFYFTKLVEIDRITCDLFAYEGKYVAFNVYTKYPESFMRDGIRRHFLPLCAVAARTFGSDPRRLSAIAGLLRKSAQLGENGSARAGYWLTFGVLEPFRRVKIDERGTRISGALVNAMLDSFRADGFDRVDGAVERTNKSAIFFYHACGFAIRDPGKGDDLHIDIDLAQARSAPENPTRGNT